MDEHALPLAEREQHAAADEGRAAGVLGVGVGHARLDEGEARVDGGGVREQRAHLRPRPVGADQQVGGEHRAVGERHLVAAVAEGAGGGDLAAPADRVVGQGVEQQVAQRAPVHFGAVVAVAAVRPAEGRVLVHDAGLLAPGEDERAELVVEAGRAQGGLAGLLVHVQHAALVPGGR